MKTSSKIAIAAAAVGAWLFAKKKGIAGIGVARKKKYKFLYRVTDGANMLANALRYTTEPKIVFNYQNSDPVEFEFGHFGIPRNAIEVERSFGKYFKPIDFVGVDVYERVAGIGKVLDSDYYGAMVTTTDGRHAVSFQADRDGDITVSAFMYYPDNEHRTDWDYWFNIGTYRTLEGAIRGAKKAMAKFNLKLSDKDLKNI